MSTVARLEAEKAARFHRYWDKMLTQFPQYRRDAVKAMGQAVKKELDAEIGRAELSGDAMGNVQSWQTVRFGDLGGYAVVKPLAQAARTPRGTAKTWRENAVTTRMITKWLDRGHGTKKTMTLQAAGSKGWRRVKVRAGAGYVKGRQFYAATKRKAVDLALNAAEKCLEKIEENADWE